MWRVVSWVVGSVVWSSLSIAHAGAPDPLHVVVERLREGDVSTALVLVESFDSELQSVPRVAYLHARLLDQVGRRSDALPILVRLASPESGASTTLPAAVQQDVAKRRADWEAALTRAPRGVTSRAAPRTPQEKLERAERLLSAGREQAAVELLRATPPRSLRARWYHTRGLALFRMRNHYDEAARELAMAATCTGETQAFDAIHAARALARADHNERAITELRKFARRFASSSFAAEATYLAAWLELRLGRQVGFVNMEKFARSPAAASAPAFKQEALWTLGYHAYVHGKLKDAERFLADAAAATQDQMAQNAANYWAARAKHDNGDVAGANAIWTAIIERDPFHWYALLARARLLESGASPPSITIAASGSVTDITLSAELPADVAFYAGIGLFEDASEALRQQEGSVRSSAPPEHALETLVRAYHAIEDHARPYHLTIAAHADDLMTAWSPSTDWIWRTTMATPHRELVAREASVHGLDASYVYAIMRKESAFDPKVVSYADALGLMQLLHGTAVKVARVLGDPEPARDDLFRPSINIRLGAALLSQLAHELGPEPALSIAGYNAGAHRVHQWLKSVSARELDRFVEEIPIDQTHNYVRRVYANWARYRYFLEPDRDPITVTLSLP